MEIEGHVREPMVWRYGNCIHMSSGLAHAEHIYFITIN